MKRKSNKDAQCIKKLNKEKNIRCRAFSAHAFEKDHTKSIEKAKETFYRPAYAGTAMAAVK